MAVRWYGCEETARGGLAASERKKEIKKKEGKKKEGNKERRK